MNESKYNYKRILYIKRKIKVQGDGYDYSTGQYIDCKVFMGDTDIIQDVKYKDKYVKYITDYDENAVKVLNYNNMLVIGTDKDMVYIIDKNKGDLIQREADAVLINRSASRSGRIELIRLKSIRVKNSVKTLVVDTKLNEILIETNVMQKYARNKLFTTVVCQGKKYRVWFNGHFAEVG
jgi:hypothetical protein